MKFVKKSECIIKSGYIIDAEGEVIGLPFAVKTQLQDLNFMYQAACYNEENQPEPQKERKPFVPKLRYEDHHGLEVEPAETPALDKAIDEALEIVKDINKMTSASRITEAANRFKALIEFVAEEEFLPSEIIDRLGTPAEWNILEWDVPELMDKIEKISEFGNSPLIFEHDCDIDTCF